MTTKATRDVIDLQVRPITEGLDVNGDCSANFAIDGVPIGLAVACAAAFTDITISGTTSMSGDLDMNGNNILNAGEDSGPAGEKWITESDSDDRDASVLETSQNFTEALVAQAVPTGVVVPFSGESAPSGWILCAGQEVNRITFASLFSVVGTKFGPGDGATTFNVPDLRGRVVAGIDNMGGIDANRLTGAWAEFIGNAAGSDEVTHGHSYAGSQSVVLTTTGPSSQDAEGAGPFNGPSDGHTHDLNFTYSWTGTTDPVTTGKVQPTMVMNFIIKA